MTSLINGLRMPSAFRYTGLTELAIGNDDSAKAAGLFKDRWEIRRLIASAFAVKTFLPNN